MQNRPHTTRGLLAAYLRPQWQRALLLALLLLGSVGLQLFSPQIIRSFIDGALAGASLGALVGTALLFLAVALLTQLVGLGATALSGQVGWQATNALRADLAEHCLRLDMPFHNARTPGELIERVDGDIGTLSNFFSQLVIQVVGSVLLMLGILVLLFWEDWRIGLALSAFTLVAIGVLYAIRAVAVPSMAADRQAHAALFGLIEERVAGLDDLRANGGGPYVMRRFQQAMREVLLKGRRAIVLGSTIWMTMMALFGVGYAIALGLGGYLYGLGLVTVGTVFLFFQYTNLLRQPLEQLSEQLKAFQQAAASIGRVRELFSIHPVVADGPGTPIPPGPLSVTFEGVSFRYDDGEVRGERQEVEGDARRESDEQRQTGEDGPFAEHTSNHSSLVAHDSSLVTRHSVLTNISFTLAPGQVLGLLGRTGSGKTTVMRLLLRLYDVSVGAITLGGVDLRDARLDELRGRVGVVTQDVQLFQASVRDNLTLFDAGVSDQRIIAVLDDLGLGPWLRSLPNGLDSELAPGGGGLSAGEAQLLAFARVFLRDPGLVILDEASSRLDPATERLIERAVDRLLAERTAIIIAHRLGTVQRADAILILDGGQIAEYGPRQALVANPASRFSQLLRTGMEEVLS